MEWVIVIVLGFVGFGTLLITFTTASKVAGYLRPYIGLALILAPIIRVALLLPALMLAASCASRTLKPVMQLRDDGQLVEALVVADSMLRDKPNNNGLLGLRAEIGALLYRDRMSALSQMSPFDLPNREIALLEAQLALPGDSASKTKLMAVRRSQDMVDSLVFIARQESDPISAVSYYNQLRDYSPYIEAVSQLEFDLRRHDEAIAKRARELADEGRLFSALYTVRLYEDQLGDVSQSKLEEEIRNRIRDEAIRLASESHKLGNSSTALGYSIIAWSVTRRDPKATKAVTGALEKQSSSIRFVLLPGFPVSMLGVFTEAADKLGISVILTEDEYRTAESQGVRIGILLAYNDISITGAPPVTTQEFSRYLDGYRNVTNPNYDKLSIKLEDARERLRSEQREDKPNPILVGWYRGRAESLARSLASTPKYYKEPVSRSYKYTQTVADFDLNFQVNYILVDIQGGIRLGEGTHERTETRHFISRSEVHPKDVDDVKPTSSIPQVEDMITKFGREQIHELLTRYNELALVAGKKMSRQVMFADDPNLEMEIDLLVKLLNFNRDKLVNSSIGLRNRGDLLDFSKIRNGFPTFDRGRPVDEIWVALEILLGRHRQGIASGGARRGMPKGLSYTESQVVDVYSMFAASNYDDTDRVDNGRRNFLDECLKSVVTVRTQRSTGSGFIVSADGLVITNNHVVDDGTDIIVTLSSKQRYFADVVHRSVAKDIAVLKIHVTGLSSLNFALPKSSTVGSRVYAIGAPFGIQNTVTSGIVSSLRRMAAPFNPLDSVDYIQTDAAINPGNSGGPLINENGDVVGMNSWKLSEAEGLGFAIWVDEIRHELEKAGRQTR